MPAKLLASGKGFLIGGGEMGARIRAHDWAATPLGPVETWPQSLRTAVSIMLNSRFPTYLAWGQDLISLYNDAYRPFLGNKPETLGRPFAEVWAEAWSTVGPIAEQALAGEASYFENMPITLERHGYPEDTWWTFSYSPVRSESGDVGGVLCTVHETTHEVTTRAALEAEKDRLRKSEAEFRTIADAAPALVWVCSASGNNIFMNESWYKFTGQTPNEAQGTGWSKALHPEDAALIMLHWQRCRESGQAYEGEVRYRRHDGAYRWHSFRALPHRDRDGTEKWFGVSLDIHDLRTAEKQLRESEARLRLAVEAGRMATFECTNGQVTAMPELKRLLGYPADAELDADEVLSHYYPGERERVAACAQKALEQGERFFEVEYRHFRLDGDLRWLLLRAEIVLGPDSAPPRIIGVVLEITDRKRAEEDLREREADLRAAMAAGSLAPFDFDHVRGVMKANPKMSELYGFPPDHTLTIEDIRSRYHPDSRDAIWAQRRQELTNPAIRAFEWTLHLLLPDGRTRWITGLGEYIRDETGRVIRSRGIVMDITERKRWEEHQRLLIHELNHRVKNTLATVQSMAAQSLRQVEAESRPKLQAFENRLFALARAHDVLTRENWEAAELREVVGEVLEPYLRGTGERLNIQGPELRLPPTMAIAFAMIVHELATNAAKYGALSIPSGRVAITWGITAGEPALLTLRWQEQNGPLVAPPTRQGFGSRLIRRSVAHELAGEVELTYDPAGLVCVVKAPLDKHMMLSQEDAKAVA
ncbi:PAS domain-containing sensor histidine kinase [Microvirga sesbaniae]|uniref:PAS domain-containing sensor histidine kinase n=1 Tax=Microvirga sesbaniae TaxID=681392 RepID=UPI0021C9E640|nr:PAS domain-containing protein [Microvirga sp. HBU67692]